MDHNNNNNGEQEDMDIGDSNEEEEYKPMSFPPINPQKLLPAEDEIRKIIIPSNRFLLVVIPSLPLFSTFFFFPFFLSFPLGSLLFGNTGNRSLIRW